MWELWISQINKTLSIHGVYQFFWFLCVAAIMFSPLEFFFRSHRQRFFRYEWCTDLLFFSGQFFIFNGLSLACLILLSRSIPPVLPWHSFIQAQPYWLQLLEIIFLCDLGIYWAHRLSHKYDFLWRFHKIHHTSERLDWLAAYREHPLDNIYTRVIENAPALLLGFPMESIAGFVFFRGLWGLFIHSNVDITLGPLGYVIGSPRLHHWHHDIQRSAQCNFANLSPLMDIMFRTYYDPEKEPERYGIAEHVPRQYWKQILYPCLPKVLMHKRTNPIQNE